jgi:hypothetical protein
MTGLVQMILDSRARQPGGPPLLPDRVMIRP